MTTLAGEPLMIGSVEIVDTFAEAFPITGMRLIVTAHTHKWANIAAAEFCGDASSVIACDCEAALERELSDDETPDGRPGVSLLAFAFSRDALSKAVSRRVGQSILTCPTTACYNGLFDSPKDKQISIGGQIRFFGDGFQGSKKIGSRRLWRIPVMDGEFVCEDKFGTIKGVAGGNILIMGSTPTAALEAAEAAASAMRSVPDIALPFPGGIVRSGSKVGSRYKKLPASTNDAYCPSLRGQTQTAIGRDVEAVYEIVIDGLTSESVQTAMKTGLHAAAAQPGVLQVGAGNYGGKLGPFHFHLRELID